MFAPDLAAGNDGFSADYFAKLFAAEAGHFWFRSRNRILIWALRRYLPQARSLLEVGCGTGYVLAGIHEACPELVCSGSEVFLEGLAIAQSRAPDVGFSQMSATHIPFESAFDVVGAFDVLEHVTDDERALGQMFQAIKPGGGVLVTVPQHRILWSAVDELACHKRRYSRVVLVERLKAAGFSDIRTTSFVSFLLPLMLARRWMHQDTRSLDASAELRIGRAANSVLERIMDAERFLIARGLTFPFGGSLLAFARKPRR